MASTARVRNPNAAFANGAVCPFGRVVHRDHGLIRRYYNLCSCYDCIKPPISEGLHSTTKVWWRLLDFVSTHLHGHTKPLFPAFEVQWQFSSYLESHLRTLLQSILNSCDVRLTFFARSSSHCITSTFLATVYECPAKQTEQMQAPQPVKFEQTDHRTKPEGSKARAMLCAACDSVDPSFPCCTFSPFAYCFCAAHWTLISHFLNPSLPLPVPLWPVTSADRRDNCRPWWLGASCVFHIFFYLFKRGWALDISFLNSF